jgi:hypothetical protein
MNSLLSTIVGLALAAGPLRGMQGRSGLLHLPLAKLMFGALDLQR